MPIRDEALAAETNAYLAMTGAATLRQAFAMLGHPEVQGSSWWHLLVARTDGNWTVGRFDELHAKAEADPDRLDTRLEDLDWLSRAPAVSQASMGTGEAEDQASRSPAQVLVVTDDAGALVGILYVGSKRGGGEVSASALTGLAGEMVDLSEFSELLIKKHHVDPGTSPEPPQREQG